jgi:putative hydrolase of the HAD superfamily
MPQFIYFDLGNVLLYFDHRRACRQMADLAGVDAEKVWNIVFESGLELKYEAGQVSTDEVYETFCRQTGTQPEFDRLALAASDIFEVNAGIKPIVAFLHAAGHRLGLLSNTNELHWRLVSDGRYGLIPGVFEQVVLSYEVGAIKPEPAIYQIAAERAGVTPREIFYVDDVAGHVAAARAAGFDAVQYTGVSQLAAELHRRGVRFNY